MGIDPTMLLGLMGNMGNSAQGAANTALSAVPTAISLMDRMRLKRDPILNLLNMRDLGQGYRAITQNPYGDPWSGWGGSFGQDASGQNVGFGEANVRAVMDMLGKTPGASTVSNYQQLAGQARPQSVDTTNGMRSLLGLPENATSPQSPMFVPQSASGGNGGQGGGHGGGGGGGLNTPNPPATAAGSGNGGIPSFNINIGGGGSGQGGGGGGMGGGLLGRFLHNQFQQRGGGPELLNQIRKPGSAMDGMMDFIRGPKEAGPSWPTHTGGSAVGPPIAAMGQVINQAYKPGQVPSYAVGTPYVPQTGLAKIHQGEAIIPRQMNPAAQRISGGVKPAPGVSPGQPMITGHPGAQTSMAATGGNMQGNGRIPMAGGAAQGAGGGGGGGVSQGASSPVAQAPGLGGGGNSLLQQVFANPMSMTPEVQQNLINQGTESLTNNYGAMARGAWDRAGALGGVGANPNMADMNFGLAGATSDLTRQVGTDAARTNFGDLMGAANLQWGATRDLANQQMQQNAFDQGLYNQDFSNMGRIIDQMGNAQSGDMQQQLALWQQINQLGQGGINFPNSFLDRLRNGRMGQLVPGSVQTPGGGGGQNVSNPFTAGNAYQLTAWD